jgi:predicted metalloprotease with PDZ domain
VAAMLDVELLAATEGKKGLDHLMQHLYEEFYVKQGRGFSDKEFYDAINKVAGKTLDIRSWVEEPNTAATRESFNQALKKLGCRLDDHADAKPNKYYTGINTEMKGDRMFVRSVEDNSPALLAGLQFGDELIAVNDIRVKANLDEAMRNASAPQSVTVSNDNKGNTEATQGLRVLISRGGLVRVLVLSLNAFSKADLVIFIENKENAVFKTWMKN